MTEYEEKRLREFIAVWGDRIKDRVLFELEDEFVRANKDKRVRFFYGVQRGCFVFDDVSYVIKVDGADEEGTMDGCNEEMRRHFEVAMEYGGAAALFNPIEKFEEGIFIQKKVDEFLCEIDENVADAKTMELKKKILINDKDEDFFADCLTEMDSYSGDFIECKQEYWLLKIFECYGEIVLRNFVRYVEDSELNDLHAGNLGFICGKPIVVDYAGCGYAY